MAAKVRIEAYRGIITWRYRATCQGCSSQFATDGGLFHRLIDIVEKHLKESKRCANTWAT